MLKGTMPDITPAQLIAVGVALLGPLIARVGFDVDESTLRTVVALGVGVAAPWILGDAHLRGQRARARASAGTLTPPDRPYDVAEGAPPAPRP
jgi:hypothetical protein